MRADRLLATLLILQRSGRITAGELARTFEVSERTIYRDIEALGAAGVPVYSETGRNGGIRLLDTYRTDLSGLSPGEAQLVPLLGLSDVLSGLGVGGDLRRTETKLLASLPEDQRKRAEQSRRRIYVDLSTWWESPESVPHLPTVVEAVFAGRRLRIRYRRGDGEVRNRTLNPLGAVVQGGTWYLVASVGDQEPRIYRVSRILQAEAMDERFDMPDQFDLASFWASRKEEFHMTRSGYVAVLRAKPSAMRALLRGHHGDSLVVRSEEQGWTTIEFTFETRWTAFERLMGFGASVVVIEPDELRSAVSKAAKDLYSLYM